LLDFLPKQWDKRIIIMFGVLFCAVALIFVGPSLLLNVHDNQLPVMIFGQAALGLFIPVSLILALPTMVELAMRRFPGQDLHVNNMSAGIFNTMNGVGEVIGPMYGAAAYEHMGFRQTSDTICLICIAYVLVYFTFGLDPMDADPQTIQEEAVNSKKRGKARSTCDISDDPANKSESLLSNSNEDLKSTRTVKNTTGATESTLSPSTSSYRSDSTIRHRKKSEPLN